MLSVTSTVSGYLLAAALAASAYTDLRTGYILDRVTLPCFALALATAAIGGSPVFALLGAAAAAAALFAIYAVSRGRAMGLGDVKLAACLGAVLGCQRAMVSLGAAFIIGGAYAMVAMVLGRKKKDESVAFAPFIAAGALAAFAFGF